MEPVSYAWDVQRGATETLGVVLATQDVFTQRLDLKSLDDGAFASWTLSVPGRDPIVRTTAANGGLIRDPDTGSLFFTMSASFTAGLPAGAVMRTVITITEATGEVGIWLDGTVTARG